MAEIKPGDPWPISREAFEAWSGVFKATGPRHRIAHRWLYALGWTFAPGVLEKWLSPEVRSNG